MLTFTCHTHVRHQAIELIKTLQASNTIPIARANMRVRITLPSKDGKRLKDAILALVSKVEEDDWSENWELVCHIFIYYFFSLSVPPIGPSIALTDTETDVRFILCNSDGVDRTGIIQND